MQELRPTGRRAFLGTVAAVLLAVPDGAVLAQGGPAIAAVVNKDIVTTRDMAERVQLAIGSAGLPDTAETKRQLAPQVLRGLIDETLQLQEAKRLNISVAQDELQRAVASIAERNRLTADALMAALRGRGIDPAVLRRQLEAQIAWIKVVNRELRSKISVTRDQVEFALRTGDGLVEEVRLAEILLPVYSGDQEAQAIDNARQLAQSVERGADFAALARELSVGATAPQGGDLGWLPITTLLPEVNEAVRGLAPGRVSAPVRTASGIQLLLIMERRTSVADRTITPEQRTETQRRLEDEQLQRLASRYLRNIRRDAFIDIRI